MIKIENRQIEQQMNTALNEQEYAQGEMVLESTPQGLGIGAHCRCNAHCGREDEEQESDEGKSCDHGSVSLFREEQTGHHHNFTGITREG